MKQTILDAESPSNGPYFILQRELLILMPKTNKSLYFSGYIEKKVNLPFTFLAIIICLKILTKKNTLEQS